MPLSCRAATTLAPSPCGRRIDGPFLVRILAVAEHLLPLEAQVQGAGKTAFGRHAGKIVGDRPIVKGRVGKGLAGQLPPQFQRGAAVGLDLLEDLAVLPGVGGDRREGMVLGRRADHRRPADVDLLDGLLERHARLADRGLEGIEVDDHQLEGQDAVLGQGLHVLGVVVPAEDAAVDLGMQRLEPPVHHLGKARVVGNVADRDAFGLQVFAGSAGAEDFHAGGDQSAGEIGQPLFIADTDQDTLNAG